MTLPVASRLAWRNLWRNPRRTALSVSGIGIGVAAALLVSSFNRGKDEIYMRAAAESGAGHLRVAPRGWTLHRDPKMRLAAWRQELAAAQALPGVRVATPRVRAEALLAMGTHVAGVEIAGVEPDGERQAYRFARQLARGRYLAPGERGAVVLGAALGRRLDAGLDDDLVVTAVGQGGRMESRMLRIVGLVATGSDDLDESIAQVPFDDVEALTGRPGAGEIAILLGDARRIEAVRAALAAQVAPADEVISWAEVTPDLAQHLKQDSASSRVLSGIVVLVVLLGVASAQLAAVLERRRELAVLAAVGMAPARIARVFIAEAVALGLGGAAVGLAVAAPLALRFARRGIDVSWMYGNLSFEGVLIEPRFYGAFGPWLAVEAVAVALGATLVASLYPAWFAARVDAGAALRSLP